jgi:exosortase/archaeosortase family protein
LPGCEGTELFVLLIAGVLAFPASWPAKLRGLALGLTLAFALNQLRVIGLYAVVRDHASAFDLVHGFVAPTALVVALGAYFWSWSGRAAAREA